MARTGTEIPGAVATTAAEAVFERPSRGSRLRAPKRDGQRAQLTIPAAVWARAEELAELIGTTPNDVLAIFASKGMQLADRQLEMARIAAERVAALGERAEPGKYVEMPSEDELEEAAQLLRRELDTQA